jgi:CelD/BcsL family acetyltransferase involved in cellulose biosynthesis
MSPPPRPTAASSRLMLIDPREDPRWERLIARHSCPVFLCPAWLDLIARTYGFPVRAVVKGEGRRLTAGLPFVTIDGPSPRLACLPFSDYADPPVENAAALNELLAELIRLYPGHEVRLRVRESPAPSRRLGFELASADRWHGLDLGPGEETLWANAHPEFRRSVRRAQRAGLSVRRLRRPELRGFYELHLAVRKRRYRLLPQSFDFFREVYRRFHGGGRGFFLGAFTPEGRLVAAHCYLIWRDLLVYKFGASDYTRPDLPANHLLHWQAVRAALGLGLQRFDLGHSPADQPGLLRYKSHLGAREGTINYYVRRAPEEAPSAAGFRQDLAAMARLATGPEVPDAVTEAVGAALYRYFA